MVGRVIVVAAVCPHPPLLVPELAAGAASELDDLRRACEQAVASLAAADTVIMVGGDDRRAYPGFAPWGVEVTVGDGSPLPLSLLVGEWLLARNGHPGSAGRVPVERVAVDAEAPAHECARLGARLAADDRRLALLVLGDGSNCRGLGAPGYDDPRAAGYDAQVARALAGVDTGALLAVDQRLSAELGVAGRAAWQVLAAAVRATGGRWRGRLLYDAAPYGVAYLVATWTPAPAAERATA
jgi:aromatic ring-opening dioxygenase LigB subunit